MKRLATVLALLVASCAHAAAASQAHGDQAAETQGDNGGHASASGDGHQASAPPLSSAIVTSAAAAVRSLSRAQDLMVQGDAQALADQAQLLAEADRQLGELSSAAIADSANKSALIVYAMSGGNPNTVDRIIGTLPDEDPMARLGRGVVDYMRGLHEEAAVNLEPFDPYVLPRELGAPLALLQGSLLVEKEPEKAAELYDSARVLAPGTIVEESALRRALTARIRTGQTQQFMKIARVYALRFVHSPYAGQFANTLAIGVAEHSSKIDLKQLEEIVGVMPDDHRRATYLRLARAAALRGNAELAAFATERARAGMVELPAKRDVAGAAAESSRLDLYGTLATITSGEPEMIRASLGRVEAARLPPEDRALLAAGKALANALESPAADSGDQHSTLHQTAPDTQPEGTHGEGPAAHDPSVEVHKDVGASASADPALTADESEIKRLDASMEDWRKRIEKVDGLLGSLKQ